jgi:MtN3 and saliva related transmembrane protein
MRILLGVAAAGFTTASWIPQVVRSARSRSVTDFSWAYLALFLLGISSWVAYGLVTGDVTVWGTNLLVLGLVATIAGIKATSLQGSGRDDTKPRTGPARQIGIRWRG